MIELRWVERDLPYDALHALVADVAALGGAVGWLHVPDRDEVARWFDDVLGRGSRVVLAEEAGQLLGCAYWHRMPAVVARQNAELSKLMTRSDARGRGIARQVAAAVIADARAAGVEVLTLDCRGNNHAALRLYAELGFVVTGRRPDYLAVGKERFDQVLLHLDLRTGPGPLTRHGGRREGPGQT